MGLHLRRPDEADLGPLLEAGRDDELTYAAVGCSLGGAVPPGFERRTWETLLSGEGAFARAVEALHAWDVHRGAGLAVRADGPLAAGTNVAMRAPLPVGSIDVACRVVAVIDEPDRFGFAYGTLPVHPERGEESFVVERTPARFVVTAVSRPKHPLARLAPPIANRLQAAATQRYLEAMRRATGC